MSLNAFGKEMGKAIFEFKKLNIDKALLVHHDDGDGLCSAAVVKTALEREGYKVKTFCLEKVYPEVIESLHEGVGKAIIYADIGSSHADFISECNKTRNFTIILDHHDPTKVTDPKVYDLNLEHYGFQGERDFSGATICYLFAKAFNERNNDLSYLALVGSCEIPQGFVGLNKTILNESLKNRVVQVKGKSHEIAKLGIRIDDLFSKLQILGPVGYYEGGPELGIKTCIEGLTENVKVKIDELEAKRKEINKRLLARLYRERLKETNHIQWFDAADMYTGMGTKVIGQFCSFLSYQTRLIKPDKYILGFVNVPPEIPNWGKLKQKLVKASVRVPKTMQKLIDEGKLLGAAQLLTKASEGFGFADGHKYAANVIVTFDKKETLIEKAEEIAVV